MSATLARPWPGRRAANQYPRWTADPSPPELPRARRDRLHARAPLLLALAVAAIRAGRVADEIAQLARAARVGADDGIQHGLDHGPSIRLHAIRTGGTVLREADVAIEDGPEPDHPNQSTRRARRARRTDPLAMLQSRGSITARELEAAETLRDQMQTAQAPTPSASQSEVHVPPHQRQAISARQIDAATQAREAFAAVATSHRAVLLWTIIGGTIAGYAQYARTRQATATERLAAGLEKLAEHYEAQDT